MYLRGSKLKQYKLLIVKSIGSFDLLVSRLMVGLTLEKDRTSDIELCVETSSLMIYMSILRAQDTFKVLESKMGIHISLGSEFVRYQFLLEVLVRVARSRYVMSRLVGLLGTSPTLLRIVNRIFFSLHPHALDCREVEDDIVYLCEWTRLNRVHLSFIQSCKKEVFLIPNSPISSRAVATDPGCNIAEVCNKVVLWGEISEDDLWACNMRVLEADSFCKSIARFRRQLEVVRSDRLLERGKVFITVLLQKYSNYSERQEFANRISRAMLMRQLERILRAISKDHEAVVDISSHLGLYRKSSKASRSGTREVIRFIKSLDLGPRLTILESHVPSMAHALCADIVISEFTSSLYYQQCSKVYEHCNHSTDYYMSDAIIASERAAIRMAHPDHICI